jgi:hypothetical protein
MKKIPHLLFVSTLLLLVSWKGSADQPSILKDIRYGVLPAYSRVTLVFGGEIRFSTDHGKSLVRLVFSRTQVAPSPRATRLRFSEGLVQNVVVSRLQGDSVSVAVTLREHTTYRCVQPSGGNEVHIDVFPKEGMTAPAVTRAPAQGTAVSVVHSPAVTRAPGQGATAGPDVRERAGGLIDVPAIARAQVEAETRQADLRVRTASSSGAVLVKAGSPLLLIGLMAMVALTSGGLVFFVMRLTGSAPVRQVPSSAAPLQLRGQARTTVLSADHEAFRAEEQEEPAEEEDGGRETSLQLARSFRRGSEEITLSRRLHTQPAAPLSVGKMQQMLARSTTQTQRLHAARKLGVGRGELDLALKLKTLCPALPKNEETI